MSSYQQSSPSRRNVVKGAAWAAPVIGVGVAAPTIAASLRIDPGINGWVAQSKWQGLFSPCDWTVRLNSNRTGGTPDGAPFGLYIYDTEDVTTISQAKVTYWLPSNSKNVSWSGGGVGTAPGGYTGCWSGPVAGTVATKTDGAEYRPYTWTYTCDILKENVSPDGRLRLQNLDVTAEFTKTSACNTMNVWAQRAITIDGNLFTFERRAGTDGSMTGTSARSSSAEGGVGVSVL